MIISGMVKSSLVDYPGLISCVLFVPGCNYNCFYCHNRRLIEPGYEILPRDEVLSFLKKRAGLLDGAVVTGGEPTLQNDLIPFLSGLKNLGYKVKLDTNGSSPGVIKQVLNTGVCDYFAVDYKAPAQKYPEICGEAADADAVLKTIGLLCHSHTPFEVRTTVIPQLSEGDLIAMAKELPQVPRYMLNRYRLPEHFLPEDRERVSEPPYAQSEIHALADAIRAFQPGVMA